MKRRSNVPVLSLVTHENDGRPEVLKKTMPDNAGPLTLRECAIAALEGNGENISLRMGAVYRDVYVFAANDEWFVVKIDKSEDQSGYGCSEEAERWQEWKDQPLGKILCPVLAHGKHNNRFFTVQPKLETYLDIRGGDQLDWYDYYCTIIYPVASKVFPDLTKDGEVPGLIGDMHSGNWGRDSDGNWLCFDYSCDSGDYV
jgi:hypothetical protein